MPPEEARNHLSLGASGEPAWPHLDVAQETDFGFLPARTERKYMCHFNSISLWSFVTSGAEKEYGPEPYMVLNVPMVPRGSELDVDVDVDVGWGGSH